jgi:TonB-dependent receptor
VDNWDTACLDDLFAAENIGPFLTVEENTRDSSQFLGDTYDASLDVYAGYVMVDTHLTDDLRLVTGPRLELSKQSIGAFVREDPDEPALTGEITGEDLLPAVSLVWAVRDDLNLRAAGSRTLARPQLREIAPFSFTNYFGGFTEQGNPEIQNTHIWNGDLRVEWFPTNTEVVAASFFAKRFVDPIEPILTAASGNGLITYQNVAGANLIGGEVEARKNFGFIADPLKDLSLIANITLAHSKVSIDLDTPGAANLRSTDRPLTNQAPWVINTALDYDNQDIGLQVRLLYNIIGRRLAFPSENPVPDIYQQPRHDLGATVSQRIIEGLRVKLTGRNLINDDYRYTYGTTDGDDKLHRRWREGIQAALSASYTY